jgi:Lon-like ATP-dependent protease
MSGKKNPFDIYFCKTKYNAYKILMGLGRKEIQTKMIERSKENLAFMQNLKGNQDRTPAIG